MMLEAAAAARWGVPVSLGARAKNHEVVQRSRPDADWGMASLAKAAASHPNLRSGMRFVSRNPAQFRYIGKSDLKLVDAPDIVSGKAQYGIDTRLDGMLYAVIARPPVLGRQGHELRRDGHPQGARRHSRRGN